jgi:polyribonucleotide nucleotidyltransferase
MKALTPKPEGYREPDREPRSDRRGGRDRSDRGGDRRDRGRDRDRSDRDGERKRRPKVRFNRQSDDE